MSDLKIRNWDKFQHYKDKNGPVPWVKLHTQLLSDYEFLGLSEVEQCRLIKIWLLAGRTGNRIPYDKAWVARQIGARTVDLDLYISRGFLEIVYDGSREALVPAEQSRTEQKRAENYRMMSGSYDIPEHELAKLLAALTDKDAKTEQTLRRICKRNRSTQNDLMVAREAAMSSSAVSPTRVAVSELQKRSVNGRTAA